MSVRMMAHVWQLDLTDGAKLVLLAFADHADDDGVCFPSLDRVAWKCGCSRRTVQRRVQQFEDAGLMTVDRAVGRGQASTYQLHPEKGVRLSPFAEKGDTGDAKRVTPQAKKGDTALSPQPSVTVKEPSGGRSRKKSKRRTPVPDSFQPTKEHLAYALEHDLDVDDERQRFVFHHQKEGTLAAGWNAAFSLWLRNAVKFRARDQQRAAEANKGSGEGTGGFWS